MAKRLLERQASLIEYMTSAAAIFGGEASKLPAPVLEGIDRTLLRVEAQFSYAKRMEKIIAVLPKTFELLGHNEATVVRAFVDACPPTTISRLENARQFHHFLSSHRMRQTPGPPYLCDVAACEIAFAETDAERQEPDRATSADRAHRGNIRRSRSIVLLHCSHDVRPIFETGTEKSLPVMRKTPLVIAMPPGASRPQVFETIPAIFDLLAMLDDWIDPRGMDAGPGFATLIADLTARGLVEVCP